MALDLGAILTAMVTPFDTGGALDEGAAVRLMEDLLEHGSDGLVLCGTTGEAPTLSDEEKLRLVRLGVEEIKPAHPQATIVAGVGHNDTRHTVELTERVTELRPDALLVVNPYYNKPSRRGIVRHTNRALQHPAAHLSGHEQ
jgi:4-hydroxy-tetrahydrodipicolinate synthase